MLPLGHEEVGRGPLPETMGRFKALRLAGDGVVIEYDVAGTEVREWWTVSEHGGRPVIGRHLSVGAATIPLLLVVGAKSNGPSHEIETGVTVTGGNAQIVPDDTLWIVRVPARKTAVTLCIALCDELGAPGMSPRAIPTEPSKTRWPQEAISKVARSTAKDAYVSEDGCSVFVGVPGMKTVMQLSLGLYIKSLK